MFKVFAAFLFFVAFNAQAADRVDLQPGQYLRVRDLYSSRQMDVFCSGANGPVTPPPPTPPGGSVWQGRVVGNGPGCNGGTLSYNPTGTACYAGDNRYNGNCYYIQGRGREQWAFSCPATNQGRWRVRLVGNGPGCNGGVLNYNPQGQACSMNDRVSYPANCYYIGNMNREQYVIDCIP